MITAESSGDSLPTRTDSSSKSGLRMPEYVALLAALMAVNALAIDIMLPALPLMGEALDVTDPNHRQYVVIAYVIGLGAAQPIFGPLSDRLGRKRPLLFSLIGYVIFGIFCVFATTFSQLVLARALQGVSAAGARVITMSIVRDVDSGSSMARTMSLVMMVFMAVPILAPNIGQIILWVASWRWIFGILVLFGLALAVWVSTRLKETLPPSERMSLRLSNLTAAYALVFRTRITLGYMLASGAIFGALFAFISSSEQLYADVYGKRETFTVYFALVVAGMVVSSFLNAKFVQRVGMRRIAHAALCLFILNNVVFVMLLMSGVDQFWLFQGAMTLSFFCFSFMGANFNAMAMEPLGKIAGTASAVLGFASTVIAGMLGAVIGQSFDGTVLPIAIGFVSLGVLTLILVLPTENWRLFSPEPQPIPR